MTRQLRDFETDAILHDLGRGEIVTIRRTMRDGTMRRSDEMSRYMAELIIADIPICEPEVAAARIIVVADGNN